MVIITFSTGFKLQDLKFFNAGVIKLKSGSYIRLCGHSGTGGKLGARLRHQSGEITSSRCIGVGLPTANKVGLLLNGETQKCFKGINHATAFKPAMIYTAGRKVCGLPLLVLRLPGIFNDW